MPAFRLVRRRCDEIPSEYFGYGLLQPGFDFEGSRPWLDNLLTLDENGVVHVPDGPRAGYEFDREFVDDTRVAAS